MDIESLVSKLRTCTETRDLSKGRELHEQISTSPHRKSRLLGNLLINMYGKCGSPQEARSVFDSLLDRNIYTWNIMLSAYALNGHIQESQQIFENLPYKNPVSWNTLMTAYAQNGHIQQAKNLFERMPDKNPQSWNIMIKGYVENGETSIAKKLFDLMPGKNIISWSVMLSAYAQEGHLQEARELFVNMPDKNLIASTIMVHAYVKNGKLEEAREMFDKMPSKNVVTWTTMIGGYKSQANEALKLFKLMDLDGIQPNDVTYIAISEACLSSPKAIEAKLIHSLVTDSSYRFNIMVVASLINLHGKCGCLEEARSLFDEARDRDLVLWTAIITAYGQNGECTEAMSLFQSMELQGLIPNEITYLNVISGCINAEDARLYFICMVNDYDIMPMIDHYISMVEVLGRAGKLEYAEMLAWNMPFEADYVTWITLLSACETHINVERGIRAAANASVLDPKSSTPYIMLSNIYACTGDEKLKEVLYNRKTFVNT